MTPEERDRLVTLEANYTHAIDAINSLTIELKATNETVSDLVAALRAGRGTWHIFIALGTLTLAALAILSGHVRVQ